MSIGWRTSEFRMVCLVLLAGIAGWFVLGSRGIESPGTGRTIDGWPVGEAGCEDRVVTSGDDVEIARGRCTDLLTAATSELDQADTGHAAVQSAALHRNVAMHGDGGRQYVAVFGLADGTMRAIGVGWVGVSTEPTAVEYGP